MIKCNCLIGIISEGFAAGGLLVLQMLTQVTSLENTCNEQFMTEDYRDFSIQGWIFKGI